MQPPIGFKPLSKLLLVYAVFMLFYILYRTFPIFPLSIIAGIHESNFQHYKTAFFSFLIVDGIEWLIYRRRLAAGQDFWNGRLLAAVFAP